MARKRPKNTKVRRKVKRIKTRKYKSRNLKTCSGAGATLVHKKSTKGVKSAAGRKLVKCK